MHPALHSWREELPNTFVRLLAYLGGAAVLSMAATHVLQTLQTPAGAAASAPRSEWVEIERPFPAFALSIPEAVDAPSSYSIRRHVVGGGRKDILTLGDADGVSPWLLVQIYRPGSEITHFAGPENTIAAEATTLGPVSLGEAAPLASKFGPLDIVTFRASQGAPRSCLAFVRSYSDPRLQISGWFCQGGTDFIERATLACALDRLTLLAAGSEPKVGALFAQAELSRNFCRERDPILASTPKFTLLWKALATRPEPRRIGR